MRNFIGNICAATGFIGCCFFGYRYFQETTSLEAFGIDVVISQGDYMPLMISGLILLAGILIKKREKR